MTESEKQEILIELEEWIENKYKILGKKNTAYVILENPRKKWFKDKVGEKTLMQDAFDCSHMSNIAWESIRKLTCVVCGKEYVKQLTEIEESEKIAEEICQFIYDLRMKYKESSND